VRGIIGFRPDSTTRATSGRSLPVGEYDGTIHCVTAWSKFGLRFAGVSVDTLLAEAGPAWLLTTHPFRSSA